MKTNMDDLNLQNAFPAMPETCHDALMRAARSVKEEKPVKRNLYRTVLVTALILAATMAVAAAAGTVFGWNDFFSTHHSDTTIPQGAQEILSATEERTFNLGPIACKLYQLYADHYTALASAQITSSDDVLICMDSCQLDRIGANGDNWIRQAERLGVSPDLTWVEAAKQLGRPLYSVRCILNAQAPYDGGGGMEDALYDADGNLSYFSMQMLGGDTSIRSLPVQMFLRAAEIDLATGEEKNVLTDRPAFDLAVAPVIDTHTYELKEDYTVGGLKLTSVRGELTPGGLYLITEFAAQDGMTYADFCESQLIPVWYDAEGQRYGWGINDSYISTVNEADWPKVTMLGMISVDKIPDTLVMALEDDNMPDKGTAPRITLTR